MIRTFPKWPLVLLVAAGAAVVWIAAFGGRATAGISSLAQGLVTMLPTRDAVRLALRNAARDYGLPPEWLDALGWQESRWRLDAVNMTGADGKRGGAWGPTQITEVTARAFGYGGPMAALTTDPALAADLTAAMVAAGPHSTLEDVAAFWNSGRRASDPTLPASTAAYIVSIRNGLAALPDPPEGVT